MKGSRGLGRCRVQAQCITSSFRALARLCTHEHVAISEEHPVSRPATVACDISEQSRFRECTWSALQFTAGNVCKASLQRTACRRQTWLPWPPHLGLHKHTTQALLCERGKNDIVQAFCGRDSGVGQQMAAAIFDSPLMMCQVSSTTRP